MTTQVDPTPTTVTQQSIAERDVQARKKWQEIVSSDAKRVVGIFDVDRSASNRWGDTLKVRLPLRSSKLNGWGELKLRFYVGLQSGVERYY